MASIDMHQGNGPYSAGVGSPGVTVHEVHHNVCAARVRDRPAGRTAADHHVQRRHHLPVSHYRATGHFGMVEPAGRQREFHPRLVPAVLAITAALALAYFGVVRMMEPTVTQRAFLLGVFLIIIGGAVVLNAITVGTKNRPVNSVDR